MPNSIEEILTYVTKQDECWIWGGGKHQQGYPMIRYQGKMYLTARLFKEHFDNIKLIDKQRVKNTCGNKLCVNPDHYQIFDRNQKGWECTSHKVNEQDRKIIKEKWESIPEYWGKMRDFRKDYPNLSETTLRKICGIGLFSKDK